VPRFSFADRFEAYYEGRDREARIPGEDTLFRLGCLAAAYDYPVRAYWQGEDPAWLTILELAKYYQNTDRKQRAEHKAVAPVKAMPGGGATADPGLAGKFITPWGADLARYMPGGDRNTETIAARKRAAEQQQPAD
jgi:hypothetical protein